MNIRDVELEIVEKEGYPVLPESFQAPDLTGAADEHSVRAACAQALAETKTRKAAVAVLPGFGVKKQAFPSAASAKIMAQEILKAARFTPGSLQKIVIALEDRETLQTFQSIVRGYVDHIQDTLGLGPYVTVDAVIEVEEGIVLIERSNPPYGWALPGGFVDCGESLETAVRREAKEETGLELEGLRQLHTYSDPDRDPRFHTVTTVFAAQGKGEARFGDDAKGLKVVPHDQLLDLTYAFDHHAVIRDYLAQKQ